MPEVEATPDHLKRSAINLGLGKELRLCTDCDEPISDSRLRAQPHAGRCTDCQEEYELLEREGL